MVPRGPVGLELEGTDVARTVAGQVEARCGRIGVGGVAQEVGRERRALQALSMAADVAGQPEVGVEEERGRSVRAGPGVDREDEGGIADEVAQVGRGGAAVVPSSGRVESVADVVGRADGVWCRSARCRRTCCCAGPACWGLREDREAVASVGLVVVLPEDVAGDVGLLRLVASVLTAIRPMVLKANVLLMTLVEARRVRAAAVVDHDAVDVADDPVVDDLRGQRASLPDVVTEIPVPASTK